jgi:AcrR family transcriptional regulator
MEIPRSLKVLWGAEAGARRGPRPALSLDRIVATAIAVADRDGLAALSMARLAQELGSAPMSLYRHVANKDELLVFMQDAAPGPPPTLPPGWRAGLATWARELRRVYFAHPWILQVTGGRPPLEPGQVAWLECGLTALADTPLTVRARLDAIMTVLYYVRGGAHVAAILMGGAPDPLPDYGPMLVELVTAERFPAVAAALGDGVFVTDPAGDGSFEAGLDLVLDGIQLSMDR